MSAPTLSVHDPDFENLVTIPLSHVHHLPPAHLEISRLVLCRRYNANEGAESCPMGDSCKFVHADLASQNVHSKSIHVNYAWRSLEDVKFDRLPAGDMLEVMAPNNRAPVQLLPSEYVLVTKGATTRHEHQGTLSYCAHYFFNRMCNRGDRCNFIHAALVDPTATEFQRAPPRSGGGLVSSSRQTSNSGFCTHAARPSRKASTESPLPRQATPKRVSRVDSDADLSSCALSDAGSEHSHDSVKNSPSSSASVQSVVYRRNPYSLLEVTVIV